MQPSGLLALSKTAASSPGRGVASALEANSPCASQDRPPAPDQHENVNEVIANRAIARMGGVLAAKTRLHHDQRQPRQFEQSDTFPTASYGRAVEIPTKA